MGPWVDTEFYPSPQAIHLHAPALLRFSIVEKIASPSTRRRAPERQDCWQIYYGDQHVGPIARGRCRGQLRIRLVAAWRRILPNVREPNFQERLDERDWTAQKYAMWARGEVMSSQKPNSIMGCPLRRQARQP
jgi:hypothetical protein